MIGLLPRFYDPETGRVLLDGRDLRSLPLAWLRQNVALVLQEPVLFSASILENIAYGRPDATKHAIIAAADAAGVSEFVRGFPEVFDTQVGERGVSLSGGQRQRISIARAFLKDAPVLIMDEPTSALDAETETQLLAALERLKEGRTTLIVAHRLSTIREADLIVAMRDGTVVETGSHQELTETGELSPSYTRPSTSRGLPPSPFRDSKKNEDTPRVAARGPAYSLRGGRIDPVFLESRLLVTTQYFLTLPSRNTLLQCPEQLCNETDNES